MDEVPAHLRDHVLSIIGMGVMHRAPEVLAEPTKEARNAWCSQRLGPVAKEMMQTHCRNLWARGYRGEIQYYTNRRKQPCHRFILINVGVTS